MRGGDLLANQCLLSPVQIPAMEVIWSMLTMVLASAKNFETLVIIRFFVGACSAKEFSDGR